MLSFQETEEYIKELKSKDNNKDLSNSIYHLKSFFSNRFSDVQEIFKQIDSIGVLDFFNKSSIDVFSEGNQIFGKGENCVKYYFLMFGDITLYSEESSKPGAKLLKTISGGVVFGHKVKDIFNYFAYANSTQVMLLSIDKEEFNNQMDLLKQRSISRKSTLLKKHIPNIRSQSEENFDQIRDRFMKLEYSHGSKLLVDGEYDEFVYLIVNGECVALKSMKRIRNLKEITGKSQIDENKSHIVIEKYSKLKL